MGKLNLLSTYLFYYTSYELKYELQPTGVLRQYPIHYHPFYKCKSNINQASQWALRTFFIFLTK